MIWTNIKNELPPIGKKLLVISGEEKNKIRILTLKYTWEDDSSDCHYYGNCTVQQLQDYPALWMEVPPLPEEVQQ